MLSIYLSIFSRNNKYSLIFSAVKCLSIHSDSRKFKQSKSFDFRICWSDSYWDQTLFSHRRTERNGISYILSIIRIALDYLSDVDMSFVDLSIFSRDIDIFKSNKIHLNFCCQFVFQAFQPSDLINPSNFLRKNRTRIRNTLSLGKSDSSDSINRIQEINTISDVLS